MAKITGRLVITARDGSGLGSASGVPAGGEEEPGERPVSGEGAAHFPSPAFYPSLASHRPHSTRSTRAPRNTTMLTSPLAPKKAASSLDRSPGLTSRCSHAISAAPTATPP